MKELKRMWKPALILLAFMLAVVGLKEAVTRYEMAEAQHEVENKIYAFNPLIGRWVMMQAETSASSQSASVMSHFSSSVESLETSNLSIEAKVEGGKIYTLDDEEVTELVAGETYKMCFQVRNTTGVPDKDDTSSLMLANISRVSYELRVSPVMLEAGQELKVKATAYYATDAGFEQPELEWSVPAAEDMVVEPRGRYIALYRDDTPMNAEMDGVIGTLSVGEARTVTCLVSTYALEEWQEK